MKAGGMRERHQGERHQGEKHQGERHQGERHQGERHQGERQRYFLLPVAVSPCLVQEGIIGCDSCPDRSDRTECSRVGMQYRPRILHGSGVRKK